MDSNFPRIGRNFLTQNIGANASAQIVNPAANTGGIIIRTVQLIAFNSSVGNGLNLYADTSAPANSGDLTRRIILNASVAGNSSTYTTTQLPFQMFIDPGFGLWFASSPGAAGGSCSITYDLVGLVV